MSLQLNTSGRVDLVTKMRERMLASNTMSFPVNKFALFHPHNGPEWLDKTPDGDVHEINSGDNPVTGRSPSVTRKPYQWYVHARTNSKYNQRALMDFMRLIMTDYVTKGNFLDYGFAKPQDGKFKQMEGDWLTGWGAEISRAHLPRSIVFDYRGYRKDRSPLSSEYNTNKTDRLRDDLLYVDMQAYCSLYPDGVNSYNPNYWNHLDKDQERLSGRKQGMGTFANGVPVNQCLTYDASYYTIDGAVNFRVWVKRGSAGWIDQRIYPTLQYQWDQDKIPYNYQRETDVRIRGPLLHSVKANNTLISMTPVFYGNLPEEGKWDHFDHNECQFHAKFGDDYCESAVMFGLVGDNNVYIINIDEFTYNHWRRDSGWESNISLIDIKGRNNLVIVLINGKLGLHTRGSNNLWRNHTSIAMYDDRDMTQDGYGNVIMLRTPYTEDGDRQNDSHGSGHRNIFNQTNKYWNTSYSFFQSTPACGSAVDLAWSGKGFIYNFRNTRYEYRRGHWDAMSEYMRGQGRPISSWWTALGEFENGFELYTGSEGTLNNGRYNTVSILDNWQPMLLGFVPYKEFNYIPAPFFGHYTKGVYEGYIAALGFKDRLHPSDNDPNVIAPPDVFHGNSSSSLGFYRPEHLRYAAKIMTRVYDEWKTTPLGIRSTSHNTVRSKNINSRDLANHFLVVQYDEDIEHNYVHRFITDNTNLSSTNALIDGRTNSIACMSYLGHIKILNPLDNRATSDNDRNYNRLSMNDGKFMLRERPRKYVIDVPWFNAMVDKRYDDDFKKRALYTIEANFSIIYFNVHVRSEGIKKFHIKHNHSEDSSYFLRIIGQYNIVVINFVKATGTLSETIPVEFGPQPHNRNNHIDSYGLVAAYSPFNMVVINGKISVPDIASHRYLSSSTEYLFDDALYGYFSYDPEARRDESYVSPLSFDELGLFEAFGGSVEETYNSNTIKRYSYNYYHDGIKHNERWLKFGANGEGFTRNGGIDGGGVANPTTSTSSSSTVRRPVDISSLWH